MDSVIYKEDFHNPNTTVAATFDLGALMQGSRHSNTELAAEANEIISRIYSVQSDAKDLIARLTKTNLERLSQEREEIVLQARASKKHYEELQKNAGLFDGTTRRLNEELNIAGMNARVAKETQLQPAYSTQADYDAQAKKIAELLAIVDQKMANYNNHIMMISTIERTIQEAAEKHNSLVKRELEIRQTINRLKGDKSPIIDMETGLQR